MLVLSNPHPNPNPNPCRVQHQEYLQLTSLPPGWLTIPNPSPGETNSVHYCNYWTGEMQAESPVTSARSPMLLTVNR